LAAGAHLTIMGNAGVNVLHLSNLLLGGGAILTLNAPATASFVLDITGGFMLSGSSQLLLSGGIRPEDVLYNVLSVGSAVGTQLNSSGGSVIYGILLAPNREIILSAGILVGEVIGGGKGITVTSGEQIIASVPEDMPVWTSMMAFLGVLGLHFCHTRRRLIPVENRRC
jgi:hypothetical protein